MRVHRVQGRAFGARVDGATPRGLWPPNGGGLCRRVVKRKVLKMDGPSAQGFLSLTAFQAEGCGGGFAANLKKRGAAGAAGCIEGLDRFAQGATAPAVLRVADCRSAAMLIKSALRINLSASYSKISILLNYLPSADTPPIRAVPDFPLCKGQNRSLCFPAETWLHG